jgi:hypothetical protein
MNKKQLIVFRFLIIIILGVGISLLVRSNQEHNQESNHLQSLLEYTSLTETDATQFHNQYRTYAPYNHTTFEFANYTITYPLSSDALFVITNSFSDTVACLDIFTVYQLNDIETRDFISEHPNLFSKNNVNITDITSALTS